MSQSRLEYLFSCYLQNNFAVQQDEEEFMTLLAQPESHAEVQKLIDQVIENTGAEMQMNDQVAASILQNIFYKDKNLVVPVKRRNTCYTFWKNVITLKKRLFWFEWTDTTFTMHETNRWHNMKIIYPEKSQCDNLRGR